MLFRSCEERVLGCVYIEPTQKSGYDAEIYLWARQSELASGLEEELYEKVQQWLLESWPFSKVAFPGRNMDWDHWNTLPEKQTGN